MQVAHSASREDPGDQAVSLDGDPLSVLCVLGWLIYKDGR